MESLHAVAFFLLFSGCRASSWIGSWPNLEMHLGIFGQEYATTCALHKMRKVYAPIWLGWVLDG
jgi:hypothetical protein